MRTPLPRLEILPRIVHSISQTSAGKLPGHPIMYGPAALQDGVPARQAMRTRNDNTSPSDRLCSIAEKAAYRFFCQ
jgi:hypothetical protein